MAAACSGPGSALPRAGRLAAHPPSHWLIYRQLPLAVLLQRSSRGGVAAYLQVPQLLLSPPSCRHGWRFLSSCWQSCTLRSHWSTPQAQCLAGIFAAAVLDHPLPVRQAVHPSQRGFAVHRAMVAGQRWHLADAMLLMEELRLCYAPERGPCCTVPASSGPMLLSLSRSPAFAPHCDCRWSPRQLAQRLAVREPRERS